MTEIAAISPSVEPYTLLAMLTTEGDLHGFPRGAAAQTPENRTKNVWKNEKKYRNGHVSMVQLLSSKLGCSEVSSDALRSSMFLFWGETG